MFLRNWRTMTDSHSDHETHLSTSTRPIRSPSITTLPLIQLINIHVFPMHSSLYTTYTTHLHPIHAPWFPSTPPCSFHTCLSIPHLHPFLSLDLFIPIFYTSPPLIPLPPHGHPNHYIHFSSCRSSPHPFIVIISAYMKAPCKPDPSPHPFFIPHISSHYTTHTPKTTRTDHHLCPHLYPASSLFTYPLNPSLTTFAWPYVAMHGCILLIPCSCPFRS